MVKGTILNSKYSDVITNEKSIRLHAKIRKLETNFMVIKISSEKEFLFYE